MKINILLILIFSFSQGFKVDHPRQLPLLKARQNFNADILDCVLNNPHESYHVIILSINKNQKDTVNKFENYEIGLTLLNDADFELREFKQNNYFGYFEYKKRTVLVYGDDSYQHFFTKTTFKKQFAFLARPLYDDKKNPPRMLDLKGCIYNFVNGKFILISRGMF